MCVCVCLCLGETDWKMLAIDMEDPKASQINSKCVYNCYNYTYIIYIMYGDITQFHAIII